MKDLCYKDIDLLSFSGIGSESGFLYRWIRVRVPLFSKVGTESMSYQLDPQPDIKPRFYRVTFYEFI